MATTQFAQFDIRQHIDRLTPTKTKGRYICPVCEGHNLTINSSNGAYRCHSGECESKLIRDAVAPLGEKLYTSKKILPFVSSKKAPKPKPPLPESEVASLVESLTPISDRPQALARFQYDTDCQIKTYIYGEDESGNRTQWVDRIQWAAASKPKGYDKKFSQFHRAVDGELHNGKVFNAGATIPSKGSVRWKAYRIAAVIDSLNAHPGIPVLLWSEGEECVWHSISIGLESITLQGSSWKEEELVAAFSEIKAVAPNTIHLFLVDNDDTGKKKGETFIKALDTAGVHGFTVDPSALSDKIPSKGDIEELLGIMTADELIALLNIQIQEYQTKYHTSLLVGGGGGGNNGSGSDGDGGDDDGDGGDDGEVVSLLTLSQEAMDALYTDTRWLCIDKKLHKWNGIYYEHSNDNIEIARISEWCNAKTVIRRGKEKHPYADPSSVRVVFSWVKMRLGGIPEEKINPPGLNCTNGVLQIVWDGCVPSSQLVAHSPDIIYLYEPLVAYNPDADPTHCDKLLQCLDEKPRDIFLKTIAASLDLKQVRKYKGRLVRALLLNGEGANGKDSLREVTAIVYSREGMTNASMADFKAYDDGRKFPLANLKHSRINWSSENGTATRLDTIQSLKAFITGDELDSERKGQDATTFIPSAIAIFNINGVPSLQGTQEAIKSRYGVITFNYTYKINANTANGEIEADPRFKYDPEFMNNEVAPAYLNKLLQSLGDLMRDGIDYSCTDEALENIQIKNSHLFQFCQDHKLGYGKKTDYIAPIEVWQKLRQWYIDNGTLIVEVDDKGKERCYWTEQAKKGDLNIKAPNQVVTRFEQLFPKTKRGKVRRSDDSTKYIQVLYGLTFLPDGGGDGGNGGGGDSPDNPSTPPNPSTPISTPSTPISNLSTPIEFQCENAKTHTTTPSQHFPSTPSTPSTPISKVVAEKFEFIDEGYEPDDNFENSDFSISPQEIGLDGVDGGDENPQDACSESISDNLDKNPTGVDKNPTGVDETQTGVDEAEIENIKWRLLKALVKDSRQMLEDIKGSTPDALLDAASGRLSPEGQAKLKTLTAPPTTEILELGGFNLGAIVALCDPYCVAYTYHGTVEGFRHQREILVRWREREGKPCPQTEWYEVKELRLI